MIKIQERFHAWLSQHFRPNYEQYIRSARWRRVSNAAKARAGWRCQGCNRPGKIVQLETHHRTYNRLGFELPQDLTVFCSDCHEAITLIIKKIRNGEMEIVQARRKPYKNKAGSG